MRIGEHSNIVKDEVVMHTSDEEAVDSLFMDAEAKLGHIDVAVLNAGVGKFGNCETLSVSDYDDTFNVNVKGVFLWLRKVLPGMRERDAGQIIVTSSNLGMKTAGRCSLYSASKFAVQSMVGCLRDELKGTGVKAATLNPGSVSTPWFDGREVEVDRSKMLAAGDVARAARLLIDQSGTSDIHHMLLDPGVA